MMNNYHEEETVPVPRKRIFVLKDGRFVIQWEENRVQDLLLGRYSAYSESDFESAITDYELNQLKNSGVVADYDESLVYLQPDVNTDVSNAGRTYYLNTTIPKSRVKEVTGMIESVPEIADEFSVRIKEIFVIIRGRSGIAYQNFDDAERAREVLIETFPDLLADTVVAFVDVNAMP